MKILTTILTILTFVSFQTNHESSIIGTWKQFAYKPNDSNEIKKTPNDCSSKTLTFRENGYYEEEMYCIKSTGKWYFNEQQTKFDIILKTFNGMIIPTSNDTTKTNKLIIKLTKDTLIFGEEAYYGKEKVYGHDDWYFVRQKD